MMSRCPVLDTSNRDSLFQDAWRIHCQKDRQGINLDMWKIITFKIKLFEEHRALLLQNAVTSATSGILKGAGNTRGRRIQHRTNWSQQSMDHPPFNPTAANLQLCSSGKVYRVEMKCKLKIINKDYTSFIVTLKHNAKRGNNHLNPKLVCKQTLNFLLKDFKQQKISSYAHTQPSRVYGIPLEKIIPCTELSLSHQFCILW